MGNDSVNRLPLYPSTQTRKSLSPARLAALHQAISSCLLQTIALPPTKRDSPAARAFIASYAKDTASQVLQGLIWDPSSLSTDEKLIRKRALLLAEKIASSPPGLEIQTLLDLSVIYAATNISQIKSVFKAAVKSNPALVQAVEADLVPAFTQLFNPAQGLYAIRKAAHCIASFLHASPPELVRCFAHSKSFVLALAALYDQGLASIANSYGGLPALRGQNPSETSVDEWQPIWVQTKVDLIDAFHVIISTLLNDVSSASGRALALESERTFDLIFAILDLPSSSTSASAPATPYLDRSLLSDYQDAYSLSRTLASALRNAAEKDARLDLLEAALQSFSSVQSGTAKDAGALKILLRSSGVAPGIDNRGNGGRVRSTASGKGKGKERALAPEPRVPDLDVKISQVLDVLPEYPPEYVRALLERGEYGGDAEKVVGALLEGTAPDAEALGREKAVERRIESKQGAGGAGVKDDVGRYVEERRNVFDDEVLDVTQLRVGKRREDESMVLRDRTFIEQMKADILRRAEAISDDEEVEDDDAMKGKKGLVLAFDDEDEAGAGGGLKIGGDGEESDVDEGEVEDAKPQSPETILELAYLRDPKLFDRDAQTRRSKARSELKAQTGWGDEQIEGWRIMLERNPRKEKILQKHEFAGNQNVIPHAAVGGGAEGGPVAGGPSGRGGRGGGGRGARGGRGGRGGVSGGADSARERAWKDKNKASRGNHNRKRGHDKKMARAGAGPSI
ncbi:putative CUE domain protein [Lyophyllum shimeji]|uniref:CUE domain protein n=1 Tax=Lyophyllum shimeji TaxID=47721 RepID=A0A9P3PT43_LYOSH|nr:putative CUE domain protein [Lyophyllum shimeji]